MYPVIALIPTSRDPEILPPWEGGMTGLVGMLCQDGCWSALAAGTAALCLPLACRTRQTGFFCRDQAEQPGMKKKAVGRVVSPRNPGEPRTLQGGPEDTTQHREVPPVGVGCKAMMESLFPPSSAALLYPLLAYMNSLTGLANQDCRKILLCDVCPSDPPALVE